MQEQIELDDELTEETFIEEDMVIEVLVIDGICGVY